MAKYHQYCPVARVSEILADRWMPLIVRALLAGSHQLRPGPRHQELLRSWRSLVIRMSRIAR